MNSVDFQPSVPTSYHASPRPDATKAFQVRPRLEGVCETMLWTLYDRASEARNASGVLIDAESIRICDALDYDFKGRFGEPTGVFAARAAEIDRLVVQWLEQHPDGQVVSLGEGLETQAFRVDNGRMRWLTVDLAPAIALREQFLPACHRFRNVAANVSEANWIDEIESEGDVLVIAQGLLMYLEAEVVGRLLHELTTRIPGAEFVFDVIPRWFSELTRWGIMQTPHYRLPPMPWGINSDEIAPRLSTWSSKITAVSVHEYRAPRGWAKLTEDLFRLNPFAPRYLPAIVQLRIAGTRPNAATSPLTS